MAKRFFPNNFRRDWVRFVLAFVALFGATTRAGEPRDVPVPGDDATYRTTVLVRKGFALGTGTIVGSVEGEALVLTAAHVVEGAGPLRVELYRYNLGWERTGSAAGFPRRLAATIAARDVDSDLAVLRVGGQVALPYVARIAPAARTIAAGTPATSIGFDRGERLVGFATRVRRFDRVDMERGGGDRRFLITDDPPEVGRSGGGLFLEDGTLAGVCLARAQLPPGRVWGMYAPVSGVWNLLRSDRDLLSIVSRSHPIAGPGPTLTPARAISPSRADRTAGPSRAN